MTREPVELREHRPSVPVALSVDERDALRALVPGLTVQPVPGSTDTYTLTGTSIVGVVRIGDLVVELRPKVGVAAVLFLVSYALDPRAWRAPPASLATDATLAEAIVPVFARAAHGALGRGLLHGYRRREEALPTVRGRVRVAAQLAARAGLPLPVEVAYDDFTPDILENRLLRTAVDVLGRLRLRDDACRRALAHLRQQLEPVGTLTVDRREVPEPRWTRLNEAYRPAVSLARLILAGAGLEARAGRFDSSAFLVDMNVVFEDFVRVALREELRVGESSFPKGAEGRTLHLDAERTVGLRPDLSWWTPGGCVFVGDCKYKRTTGSVPNADVYQMLAYLTALRLPEGLLVYGAGEDVPRDVTIEHAGARVHVRTLDVARPPHEVLTAVKDLAASVRALAARQKPILAK